MRFLALAILAGAGAALAAEGCLSGEVLIEASTRLAPGCTHRATLRIAASHVTLDCGGSLIDAAGRDHGIVVGGAPDVHSVTVRNCRVVNGKTGIYVGWPESDTRKASRHTREELYARTPHDVRIETSSVRDSERVGIYIDDYASGVVVSRTGVAGCGSAGIYLEHSSRRNTIEQSTITNNGYGRFPFPRWGVARREGIAIDSSAHNRVISNRIAGNAAGAVFLYKNCHERATTNPDSPPRWQQASHNRIAGNTIEDEAVGVWLASRQSRDLSTWDCGDRAYWGNSHFPDYARHNVVEGNLFRAVRRAVVVEDDDNSVIGNTFVDVEEPVTIGAQRRQAVLGRPVRGTLVKDNAIARGTDTSGPP